MPVQITASLDSPTITPSEALGLESGKEARVDTPSLDYLGMADHWELITDLQGGTQRMRLRGRRWLPQEPRESDKAYTLRLSRSFLYSAYPATVDKLAARPFVRPVGFTKDLPPRLAPLTLDVDRVKTTLTEFSRALLADALHYGKTHILVDFSRMPADATIADEQAANARPVFVHVTANNLIGWRVEKTKDGRELLKEIRIAETHTTYPTKWGEKKVKRIRVFTSTEWFLFEEQLVSQGEQDSSPGGPKFVEIDSGTHTFGSIPLATLYTRKTGFLNARPPLENLAWMNLAHYQSLSEQRNCLRFARVGLLFGSGFTEEDLEKGITIGPNSFVGSTNEAANLKYVEHSGKAIGAGREDLLDLEARMEVLGLQPMLEKSGGAAATGIAIEEAKSSSALQAWVRALEATLTDAFRFAAQWLNITLPKEFKADIFNDFSISPRVRDDILALLEARAAGEITSKTLLKEFKRRGLLSDTIDPEQEAKDAKEDPPHSTKGTSGMIGTSGPRVRDPLTSTQGGQSERKGENASVGQERGGEAATI